MAEDVYAYLQSKGLQLRRGGINEVHTTCFLHGEDPQSRGRLYINIDPTANIPGLFHCVTGETGVVTWNGVVPIEKLAGDTHRLMTEEGRWVDAPVRSFGIQDVLDVTITRNGVTQTIGATDEHRWFVRRGSKRVEMFTRDLKKGDRLSYSFGQGCKAVRPSPFGIAHGVVFGDGTRAHKGSVVNLHGWKDRELLQYFNGASSVEHGTYVRVTDLPAFFKDEPNLDESRSYLYGFLAGYIAADGTVSKDGQVSLWSADLEALRFVETLCLRIGVGTYGVRGPYQRDGQTTKFGNRPLYSIGFIRSTITADLLLVAEHRRRFNGSAPKHERKGWVVQDVEDNGRREEVFCAVVPEYESFVLEGNILTGNCKVCDARGSLVSIKKHFGDYEANTKADFGHQQFEILGAAATYYHDALADHDDIFGYLRRERGLSLETIIEHKLGYADGGLFRHLRGLGYSADEIMSTGLCVESQGRVVDSLVDMITLPYHITGNVVMIRGRARPDDDDPPAKYKTPPKQDSRLFNSGVTWGAEEVFITEGEFDCLILSQLGFTAVGSPGANTWQDSWDGYLADAKRIYVVFDNDEAGDKGFDRLKERFGARVRRIVIPEDPGQKNDPTEWIVTRGHTASDFRELVAEANKGGLLITVHEARAEHASVQGAQGLRFNITELDAALHPGLMPAQLFVPLAKSGTGKTIFLLNLMHRMAMHPEQEHLRFLFLSLEQTRGEWFERARRIYRFYNLDSTDDECAAFWQDRLMLVDANRVSEQQLITVLDDYEYRTGFAPDVVMLDYLGYWANSFKGERYERTSDAVMGLKAIAKDRRIPFVAPHQVSRIVKYGEEPDGDVARDAGVVEETADFVMVIWNADDTMGRTKEDRVGEIVGKVTKSRHGGKGTRVTFQWAPVSLALVPHGEPDGLRYKNMAKDELGFDLLNDRWEVSVERHRGRLPKDKVLTPADHVALAGVLPPGDR